MDGESIGGSEKFSGDEAGEYKVTLTAYSRRWGDKTSEASRSIFVSDQVKFVTNSPVRYDETITIEPRIGRFATYEWKGPNGFTSEEMNVSIPHANAGSAGVYGLVASINGKSSATSTVNVVVNPLDASCNPPENTFSFTGGIITGNAYTGFTLDLDKEQFEMYITDKVNQVTLRFNTSTTPFPGMYEITQNFSDIKDGQVYIDIKVQSNLENAVIKSGTVFVSENAGNISAVFCAIPFSYMGHDFTVTGRSTLNLSGGW